jgi:hypothetical protein
MTVFFCFFTLPVATLVALPSHWLWSRYGPIHSLYCAAIGGVIGILTLYIPLLTTSSLHWKGVATIWFGFGGIAAAVFFGWIVWRGEQVPIL